MDLCLSPYNKNTVFNNVESFYQFFDEKVYIIKTASLNSKAVS